MVSRASLRASDTDRDAVAERLREAFYEGRIRHDELEERLAVALSAQTYGELDAQTEDLPAPVPAPAAVPAHARDRRSLQARAAGLLTVALTLATLGAAAAPRYQIESTAGGTAPGHDRVYESFNVAAPLVGLLGILVLLALLRWLFWQRSTPDT